MRGTLDRIVELAPWTGLRSPGQDCGVPYFDAHSAMCTFVRCWGQALDFISSTAVLEFVICDRKFVVRKAWQVPPLHTSKAYQVLPLHISTLQISREHEHVQCLAPDTQCLAPDITTLVQCLAPDSALCEGHWTNLGDDHSSGHMRYFDVEHSPQDTSGGGGAQHRAVLRGLASQESPP